MGWYFRQSFRLGPFRINLSNSGVSSSFGFKGARINFSKRGTYINLGSNGIRYRQRLANPYKKSRGSNIYDDTLAQDTSMFDSTPVNGLTDTASQAFIDELQQKGSRKSLMFWLALLPSFAALIGSLIFLEAPIDTNKTFSAQLLVTKNSVHIRKLPSVNRPILKTANKGDSFKFIERVDSAWFKVQVRDSTYGYIHSNLAAVQPKLESVEIVKRFNEYPRIRRSLLVIIIVLLCCYCSWIYRVDKRRRTIEIYYQMDEKLKMLHEKFIDCFREFASSKKIWSTQYKEEVTDQKYHGGATQLVSRDAILSISDNRKPTTFVKTNIRIPYIGLKGISLFFFPERLVLEKEGQFAAVLYKNLSIAVSSTKFIETDPIARDATIVDYTWRFLNKNGNRDLRFGHNPRLPICLYSLYNLRSTEGLDVAISTSKPGAMNDFASFINTIAEYQKNLNAF